MNYPVNWVKLEKYAELTGDSVDAVMARRKAGKWLDGNQCKIVDGRLWINLAAVEAWIEGTAQPRRIDVVPVEPDCEPVKIEPGPIVKAREGPVLAAKEVLWDMGDIAAYLKRNPQVVRERMACLPSFPKSIRLPSASGRSQPLYLAEEVIAWTRKFKDKN